MRTCTIGAYRLQYVISLSVGGVHTFFPCLCVVYSPVVHRSCLDKIPLCLSLNILVAACTSIIMLRSHIILLSCTLRDDNSLFTVGSFLLHTHAMDTPNKCSTFFVPVWHVVYHTSYIYCAFMVDVKVVVASRRHHLRICSQLVASFGHAMDRK